MQKQAKINNTFRIVSPLSAEPHRRCGPRVVAQGIGGQGTATIGPWKTPSNWTKGQIRYRWPNAYPSVAGYAGETRKRDHSRIKGPSSIGPATLEETPLSAAEASAFLSRTAASLMPRS